MIYGISLQYSGVLEVYNAICIPKINFINCSRLLCCCKFPGPRHPSPPPPFSPSLQFEIPGEIKTLSCPRKERLNHPNNALLSSDVPRGVAQSVPFTVCVWATGTGREVSFTCSPGGTHTQRDDSRRRARQRGWLVIDNL